MGLVIAVLQDLLEEARNLGLVFLKKHEELISNIFISITLRCPLNKFATLQFLFLNHFVFVDLPLFPAPSIGPYNFLMFGKMFVFPSIHI